jgi:hypothetical protein
MTFFNIVQNKSVAVVGNAMSLHDMNFGKNIDSHDIVIRMNIPGNMYYKNLFRNAYGVKTDVWCFWNIGAFMKAHENDYTILYKRYFENNKIYKLQIQEGKKRFKNYHRFEILYDDAKLSNLETTINQIYPLRLNRKKFKFSTGFLLLNYLCECDTKHVSIYGMDFKKTPTFYQPENHQNIKYGMDMICGHDYIAERCYTYTHIISKYKKFTLVT